MSLVGVQTSEVSSVVPIIATVERTGFIGWARIDRAECGKRTWIIDSLEGQCKIFEHFRIELLWVISAELRAENWHSLTVPDGTQRIDKSTGKPG